MIRTFERNPCQPNIIEHCSSPGTTLPTWPAICTFCHNQLLQMHWPSQATNQVGLAHQGSYEKGFDIEYHV